MTTLDRARRVGALAAGCAVLLATLVSAPPVAAVTSPFCSERPPGDTEACVAALSRDGVAIGPADPDWVPSIGMVAATGEVLWSVAPTAAPFVLPADEQSHTWSIMVNTRSLVPRLSQVKAEAASTLRASGSGENFTTITGRPVLLTGGCDQSLWPWVCPAVATAQGVQFSGHITDYRSWTNAAQRVAFYGSDVASNIDATEFPPQIVGSTLIVNVANSHYLMDGTTPVSGFVRMRLPYGLLAKVFGVSDPASLAAGGVTVTVGGTGGGTSVIAPSGDGALLVDIVGLTFSTRRITVKRDSAFVGRPGRPRAKRVDGDRARLNFAAASTRGVHVVRYQARCVSRFGHVVEATSRRSPTRLRGLLAGQAYTCRVRAVAKNRKAWFQSRWSAPALLRRR